MNWIIIPNIWNSPKIPQTPLIEWLMVGLSGPATNVCQEDKLHRLYDSNITLLLCFESNEVVKLLLKLIGGFIVLKLYLRNPNFDENLLICIIRLVSVDSHDHE